MPKMGWLPGEESFLVCCLQIEIWPLLAALGVANYFPPLPSFTKVQNCFTLTSWRCLRSLSEQIHGPASIQMTSPPIVLESPYSMEKLCTRMKHDFIYFVCPNGFHSGASLTMSIREAHFPKLFARWIRSVVLEVCRTVSSQGLPVWACCIETRLQWGWAPSGINTSQRSSVMDLLDAITDLKGNGCNADNTCNTVQSTSKRISNFARQLAIVRPSLAECMKPCISILP